ncbi:NUDIX domain-containing protein [Aestuariispira insulae]|uniref:ADP-ribose pyrophosphatase n=1 Tax=Aestuariispira insulae TaxID=1461337 RepID=A0A3D9HND1_9PROT|nr:NUDIX domain-containing protein [Aestuariispira insulae]RED51000.1 ADP-ribose pyrophosphatase [Aestuariispira insulae]
MTNPTRFTRGDVELIARETRFKGYFQVDEYTLRHRKYDGSFSDPIKREIFERGHAVVCLPYDPVRDEVVLIEQFRPGAYASGREDCWLVETIAGIIEKGESPEDVAKREAFEEAGCEISDLVEAGNFMPSAGGCSEENVLFIARCDARTISGHHGLDDEGEDIRAFTLAFDQALEAAIQGKLVNMSLVTALFWLSFKRQDLRSRWLGLK